MRVDCLPRLLCVSASLRFTKPNGATTRPVHPAHRSTGPENIARLPLQAPRESGKFQSELQPENYMAKGNNSHKKETKKPKKEKPKAPPATRRGA